MFSVPRLKEFTSTLRFRLVVWITLVVFVMVFVTNLAVHMGEQRMLRYEYDKFLNESLETVSFAVMLYHKNVQQAVSEAEKAKAREELYAALKEKVRAYEYRTWFLQLYDAKAHLTWSSSNAPTLEPPSFSTNVNGPYEKNEHRILEMKLPNAGAEYDYIRCGFLKSVLQEDIDLVNRILLVGSISILLFAPLGGYVIALRATRPISQIITTTAHLQPSKMNERLPIRGTGDELDQLSRTINGMLDRLASYIDQNRDFVANAAHELRSPLAAIRSSVEVGLNRSRTPEQYAAILTDVMEEISRLVGLVNRLLILAEGDSGRVAGQDHCTRLDKIVRESVDMFDAVAESKGVRLIIGELASALVPGDETYLRQVVRNLIDNAIKYNKSTGEVQVNLRIDPVSKNALFTVRDSGLGIDADVLPRIFERFYRADRARSREKERRGYGLGLSICQTIVHALNGVIVVASEAGAGSTFTVRLPLVEDPAAISHSGDKQHPLPVGS